MTEKQIVDKVVSLLEERMEQMLSDRLGPANQDSGKVAAPAVKAKAKKKPAAKVVTDKRCIMKACQRNPAYQRW